MIEFSEIIPEFQIGKRTQEAGAQVAIVIVKINTVYQPIKGVAGKSNHIPEYHEKTENLKVTPSF